MWLLYVGVLLLVLKLIGLPTQIEDMSWWWVAAPFVGAAVWFEIFERRLGLDKKKAFDEMQEIKKERIKKSLERDKQVQLRR